MEPVGAWGAGDEWEGGDLRLQLVSTGMKGFEGLCTEPEHHRHAPDMPTALVCANSLSSGTWDTLLADFGVTDERAQEHHAVPLLAVVGTALACAGEQTVDTSQKGCDCYRRLLVIVGTVYFARSVLLSLVGIGSTTF